MYAMLAATALVTTLAFAPVAVQGVVLRERLRICIGLGVVLLAGSVFLNEMHFWSAREIAIEMQRISPLALDPWLLVFKSAGILSGPALQAFAWQKPFKHWSWIVPTGLAFAISVWVNW